MVYLPDLWLPILLSAVVVFIASSIIHMLLPIHRGDYRKLPDEEKVLAAMREVGVEPGDYIFPCPDTHGDMSSPEMLERYERGPVGSMTVLGSGPPAMTANLVQWFVFSLVISLFAAYVAGRALGPGADYLAVFRMAGVAAFLGYAGSEPIRSIWWGKSWTSTLKNIFDGLVYGLLTGGVFGWLWPGPGA